MDQTALTFVGSRMSKSAGWHTSASARASTLLPCFELRYGRDGDFKPTGEGLLRHASVLPPFSNEMAGALVRL